MKKLIAMIMLALALGACGQQSTQTPCAQADGGTAGPQCIDSHH